MPDTSKLVEIDHVREKLIEIYSKLEDEGLAVIAGKKQMADLMIANGVTVQKWIPVTERLPDKKGEYLVAYHPCWWDDVKWDEVFVGTDTFRGKTTWAKKKFQRVTHWMPLPEPPKGD